jgi:hypothetical protein
VRHLFEINEIRRKPMATPFIAPNVYHLNGHHLHITYSTTSFGGKPQFDYQDTQRTLHFEGDDIRTVELEIGTLVTVTIQITVDSGSTVFSLLIPQVNLERNEQGQIHTEGLTTMHRFSLIPALNRGQMDLYSVVSLRGTAQVLDF